MRDNSYDLTYNIQKNWPTIGRDPADKLHVYVCDMDNYYLNLEVHMLEDILKATDNPPARADFQYGRPMTGHGWQPMPNPEMIRMMAERINKTSPGVAASTPRCRYGANCTSRCPSWRVTLRSPGPPAGKM